MTQQHRIPNTVVGPKNRRKCMVSRGSHHVSREHGARDAMFRWKNDAALTKPGTLFIFAHHLTSIGPITIA